MWLWPNLGNMAFVYSCNTVFCPHLPEDSATSLRAIKRLSPSTKANDRFTHPGYEWSGSPFLTTWVNPAAMPFTSRLDSSVTLLWSYCENNTLNDWGSTLQGWHFCNDKGILQMRKSIDSDQASQVYITSSSSKATSQAAPSPTANTCGTVPLRMPLEIITDSYWLPENNVQYCLNNVKLFWHFDWLLLKLYWRTDVWMTSSTLLVSVLHYKTHWFHVAVRLFGNRSQMTSKCDKNISGTLAKQLGWLFFSSYNIFTSVHDLSLNWSTATRDQFVNHATTHNRKSIICHTRAEIKSAVNQTEWDFRILRQFWLTSWLCCV